MHADGSEGISDGRRRKFALGTNDARQSIGYGWRARATHLYVAGRRAVAVESAGVVGSARRRPCRIVLFVYWSGGSNWWRPPGRGSTPSTRATDELATMAAEERRVHFAQSPASGRHRRRRLSSIHRLLRLIAPLGHLVERSDAGLRRSCLVECSPK